ncbi:hypothetical protein BJ170DRAFT_685606 [Xylariales sp. AK1849]|nr:hypothetical protein BJ170DRAFT_685606 [Xylariales sp. AK1849]
MVRITPENANRGQAPVILGPGGRPDPEKNQHVYNWDGTSFWKPYPKWVLDNQDAPAQGPIASFKWVDNSEIDDYNESNIAANTRDSKDEVSPNIIVRDSEKNESPISSSESDHSGGAGGDIDPSSTNTETSSKDGEPGHPAYEDDCLGWQAGYEAELKRRKVDCRLAEDLGMESEYSAACQALDFAWDGSSEERKASRKLQDIRSFIYHHTKLDTPPETPPS